VEQMQNRVCAVLELEEVDAHVDDPEFADLVAERYLTISKEAFHV